MPSFRRLARKREEPARPAQAGGVRGRDANALAVSAPSLSPSSSGSLSGSSSSALASISTVLAATSTTSDLLNQSAPSSLSSLAPSPKRSSPAGSTRGVANDAMSTLPKNITVPTTPGISLPSPSTPTPGASTKSSSPDPNTKSPSTANTSSVDLVATNDPSSINTISPAATSDSSTNAGSAPSVSSPTPLSTSSSSAEASASTVSTSGPFVSASGASSSESNIPAVQDRTQSSGLQPPGTVSKSVYTSLTTATASNGSLLVSTFVSTSTIANTPTNSPASSSIVAAAHTSNSTKTTVIAGVVGGIGGVALLVMLIFFFCVRRRRRQHAEPLDWETVQTAGIFHGVLRTPRTPKTPPSSTGHDRAASPEMSQQSHTSQYALAPGTRERLTSPTGSARTTISPLLIVATSPRSETSYHTAEDADPFADPLAMARMRPPRPAASPTIRVSDTTLVDPGTRLSAFKSLAGAPKYGYDAKFPRDPHDSHLLPPPALAPTTGARPNRLSHGSLEETLPSPNGSVDTGCAI